MTPKSLCTKSKSQGVHVRVHCLQGKLKQQVTIKEVTHIESHEFIASIIIQNQHSTLVKSPNPETF